MTTSIYAKFACSINRGSFIRQQQEDIKDAFAPDSRKDLREVEDQLGALIER